MSGFKSNCGSESVFGRSSVVRSGHNTGNDLTNGCGCGSLGEVMAPRIHLGKHLGLGERIGLGVNGSL